MNNLDSIREFSISNDINLCKIDGLDCECKNNFQNFKNENFNCIESEEVLIDELKINSNNLNIYNVKKHSPNFINFTFALTLIIIFLIVKQFTSNIKKVMNKTLFMMNS
ncbi:MAG: hypothetical protein AD073_000007 [Mycoplasmataceae bacterium]|nr:MAG: hypothetical protein AD073_000007 [Mycoplasmataceae bacterium]